MAAPAILAEYPALRRLLTPERYRQLGADEGEDMPKDVAGAVFVAATRQSPAAEGDAVNRVAFGRVMSLP